MASRGHPFRRRRSQLLAGDRVAPVGTGSSRGSRLPLPWTPMHGGRSLRPVEGWTVWTVWPLQPQPPPQRCPQPGQESPARRAFLWVALPPPSPSPLRMPPARKAFLSSAHPANTDSRTTPPRPTVARDAWALMRGLRPGAPSTSEMGRAPRRPHGDWRRYGMAGLAATASAHITSASPPPPLTPRASPTRDLWGKVSHTVRSGEVQPAPQLALPHGRIMPSPPARCLPIPWPTP